MHDRSIELGSAPISRLIVRYSTPAMIAMFVNSTYNLVDTIFVGRGAGTLALAGLAVSWPLQMIVIAMGMGVGIGTASIVSRSLGAGDRERAERVAVTSFAVMGLLSVAITILGLVFLRPLLSLFGATEGVMPYAMEYMSIILLGTVFTAPAICANSVARAEGSARVAMTSMIIGAVTNVMLDPIFIFGLHMGIRGAAIATVIATMCTFAYMCHYFLSGKSILRIQIRHLRPDFGEMPEVFAVGSSSFFQMVTGSIMAIPINMMIVRYGSDLHLAILGVANRSMMFFFMPIYGLVQGLQPIVGFNYGARNLDRVREAIHKAAIISTILSTAAFLILMFATRPILALFSTDQMLIAEGLSIVHVLILCMPFVGFQMVGGSLFQALGKARPAFVLALSRQALILLPLVFILPPIFGLQGLWTSFPIADFASTLMTAAWVYVEMRALRDGAASEAIAVGP